MAKDIVLSSLTCTLGPAARIQVLTGYAYETVPNKPIVTGKTKGPEDVNTAEPSPAALLAPEPASLGLLAMGAPALSIWRREESTGIAQ